MQMDLAQPAGASKLHTGDGTTFGGADSVKTGNRAREENLRHYRKNGKSHTAKMLPQEQNAGALNVRLQILQQALRDFAAVAEIESVRIMALPQRESTAIVLVGIGYCRKCGNLYNGYCEGCPNCGSAANEETK